MAAVQAHSGMEEESKPRSLPTGISKTSSGKYYGQMSDLVHKARNPASKSKQRLTPSFATVEEAVKAYDEMKAKMTSEYDAVEIGVCALRVHVACLDF